METSYAAIVQLVEKALSGDGLVKTNEDVVQKIAQQMYENLQKEIRQTQNCEVENRQNFDKIKEKLEKYCLIFDDFGTTTQNKKKFIQFQKWIMSLQKIIPGVPSTWMQLSERERKEFTFNSDIIYPGDLNLNAIMLCHVEYCSTYAFPGKWDNDFLHDLTYGTHTTWFLKCADTFQLPWEQMLPAYRQYCEMVNLPLSEVVIFILELCPTAEIFSKMRRIDSLGESDYVDKLDDWWKIKKFV